MYHMLECYIYISLSYFIALCQDDWADGISSYWPQAILFVNHCIYNLVLLVYVDVLLTLIPGAYPGDPGWAATRLHSP